MKKRKKISQAALRRRLAREARKAKPLSAYADLLEALTGHTREWWFKKVQRHIALQTGEGRYEGHGETNVEAWLHYLRGDILATSPKTLHDENMRAAAVHALVLGYWFLRIQRAKCMDPRRPKKIRQRSYQHWLAFAKEFSALTFDERFDPKLLPGQRWQNPFDPKATSGRFV